MPSHAASVGGDPATATSESLLDDLEQYRRELTGYCSRKLGSTLEADDAAQETILRAWRGMARFEGRSSLRTWLYRIATNVCVDMVRHPQRRALPIGVQLFPGSDSTTDAMIAPRTARTVRNLSARSGADDPAEVAECRDSVRLAFATALLHLPPRQVAALMFRDILRWSAADVAELFDTTVPAVNSALQRARATLADPRIDQRHSAPSDTAHRARLARYLDAFERCDVESLVALLRQETHR
jgi:RNA polymerase sigma-70 factor (ECF subfamily)